MGRGLSDLQKDILLMAYENEQAGHEAYHDETGPVITAHVKREQILRERFGWQPDGRFGWFCRNFSRTDIGHDRYNATMASLSRSLHRLEARGPVYLTHSAMAAGWSGAELTEEGRAEVLRILERRNAIG